MQFKEIVDQLCEDLRYEVYDMLASIKDPEFPDKTLGELKTTVPDTENISADGTVPDKMVINEDDIHITLLGYEPSNDSLYELSPQDDGIPRAKQPRTSPTHIEAAKEARFMLKILIYYTPTVAHCSLTSLIGLCLHEKLTREVPITAHTQIFNILLGYPEDDQHSIKHFFRRLYRHLDDSTEDNMRTHFKILVTPGSHSTESETNRQIADKERVSAALESADLRQKIDDLIEQE